jgi:hypothetical protein
VATLLGVMRGVLTLLFIFTLTANSLRDTNPTFLLVPRLISTSLETAFDLLDDHYWKAPDFWQSIKVHEGSLMDHYKNVIQVVVLERRKNTGVDLWNNFPA